MTAPIRYEAQTAAVRAALLAALWGFIAEAALEHLVGRAFGSETAEYVTAGASALVFGVLFFLLMWRQVTGRLEREEMHVAVQTQLRAAYGDLERRVEERTAELAHANGALQAEVLERKRTESELKALLRENARLHREEQHAAALEQRQRLARDLHDSLSQTLYGISLGAQAAREAIQTGAGEPIGALDYVLSLTETALKDMRALIRELRPESVERDGLVAAISRQVDVLCKRHSIEATAELGSEPDVSPEVKEALYRIALEALNNTARHAQATQVEVRLGQSDHTLTLEVTDNGRGFDCSAPVPGHLGLLSMQERAAEFAGSLEIDSHPGQGTVIRATIPVTAPAPA